MLSEEELEKFWDDLAAAGSRVLMLDYDGTLAPFHLEREKATPYPSVMEILNEIQDSRGCRVVLVSGRRIDGLLPLLNLKKSPEIWGVHGIERQFPDGRRETAELDWRIKETLEKAFDVLAAEGFKYDLEKKPGCLALHWHGVPNDEVQDIRALAIREWSRIITERGISLHRFDGGLELRADGFNKGNVVETVLSEEEDNTVAAYLGDDLTDEDAFRTIKGQGLGVLVRGELRPTEAGLWLRPPDELLQFLRTWCSVCAGNHRSA